MAPVQFLAHGYALDEEISNTIKGMLVLSFDERLDIVAAPLSFQDCTLLDRHGSSPGLVLIINSELATAI